MTQFLYSVVIFRIPCAPWCRKPFGGAKGTPMVHYFFFFFALQRWAKIFPIEITAAVITLDTPFIFSTMVTTHHRPLEPFVMEHGLYPEI